MSKNGCMLAHVFNDEVKKLRIETHFRSPQLEFLIVKRNATFSSHLSMADKMLVSILPATFVIDIELLKCVSVARLR